MDKSDIRKYGPQNMRLRTTKDVDGPDWHLTEYAATARIGRAKHSAILSLFYLGFKTSQRLTSAYLTFVHALLTRERK
jgi:hypothetical protein